jgi:hypothetical protein
MYIPKLIRGIDKPCYNLVSGWLGNHLRFYFVRKGGDGMVKARERGN